METRFKGKSLTGEWVYGYLVDENHIINKGIIRQVVPRTISQFTGLYCSKGIAVYGNDKIYVNQLSKTGLSHESTINIVKWIDRYASYGTDKDDLFDWAAYEENFEVVGNIYDNYMCV